MQCVHQPNPDPQDNSLRVGVVTVKDLESKVPNGSKLAIGVEISLHWSGLHSELTQTRLYKVFQKCREKFERYPDYIRLSTDYRVTGEVYSVTEKKISLALKPKVCCLFTCALIKWQRSIRRKSSEFWRNQTVEDDETPNIKLSCDFGEQIFTYTYDEGL